MNSKKWKSFVLAALFAGPGTFFTSRLGAQTPSQTTTASAGFSRNAPVAARITKAIDETQRVQLKGNVHPLAQARFDQGTASDAAPVTRAVVLLQRSPEQEAGLRQLLDDQQNKSSANFHAWLTPEQFGKQFGPADSDVQAVTQWLTLHGFQNIQVYPGRMAIEFSGNVGQVREAFHTDIHKFQYKGEAHSANVSNPQIPEALAPVVAGVVGLHNFAPRANVHPLGTFRKTKSTGEVKPLFTFSGGICGAANAGNCFAVGPADFAKIYNVTSGTTGGAGVTIGIVGDSNINAQDVIDFRSMFGLPANFLAKNNIIVNGPDPGILSDEVEADLDTQWAGAIAPAANVLLVVTEQPQSGVGAAGVDLSALYIINNNSADILSKSFGVCEAFEGSGGNAFESTLYEQASAQGITVLVSSGDNGSAGCDPSSNPDLATMGLAVSGDASTPFNTAVGGTDFNQNSTNISQFWNTNNTGTPATTSAKGYIPETTWNATCASAGVASGCTAAIISTDASKNQPGIDVVAAGGGASNCANQSIAGVCISGYTKPSWQAGPGVPTDGVRDIPDVSLFASNGVNGSFYIICQQDANSGTGSSTSSCDLTSPFNDFQGVGGTSAAAPAFAGVLALVVQKTGQRQGNVNYVLYPMAAQAGASCASVAAPAANCIFYDTPSGAGNISVACQGGSPNCSNTSTASTAVGIMTTTTGGTTPAFVTGTGYDLATGLGSVNVTNLVNNWAAATFRPTTTTFVLNGGATVTGVAHGSLIAVAGTVKPNSGTGTPTGLVQLIDTSVTPGTVIDTFSVSSTGTFGPNTSMLPGTTTGYSVIARYGGDGTFAASNSPTQPVSSVGKEPSKVVVNLVTFDSNNNPILSTSATSLAYGAPYILQIAVSNSAGSACAPPPFSPAVACPTGSVSLFDGGSALNDFLVPNTTTPTNTALLNNAGVAEDQPIQLGPGGHSITATYAGDASFNAPQASSNTLSLTITKATTTTTVAPVSGTITPGTSVMLTATVSSNSNSALGPTGNVQFMSGSTALGAAVVCKPAAATASAGASCTATASAMLSMLLPPAGGVQRRPGPPVGLLWLVVAMAMVLACLASRMSSPRQRRYAYAMTLFLLASAMSVAGCGGGSTTGGGGGGGGSHIDNVTAVYAGDANYTGSTSPAIPVTVQ